MRSMRASPANRSRVFSAVRVYWFDTKSGIGADTLVTRTGLDEETCVSCCDALEASGVLIRVPLDDDHTVWVPAGFDAPRPVPGSLTA